MQATLIGAGRVGVAFAGDPQSALLLTISARALGTDRVVLLIDPSRHPIPQADELAHVVATDLGLPVLHAVVGGHPGRVPHELPVDTVAYCDIPDVRVTGRVPVRAVGDRRVLYPFALAGLISSDIERCARALGLGSEGLRASGTGT